MCTSVTLIYCGIPSEFRGSFSGQSRKGWKGSVHLDDHSVKRDIMCEREVIKGKWFLQGTSGDRTLKLDKKISLNK